MKNRNDRAVESTRLLDYEDEDDAAGRWLRENDPTHPMKRLFDEESGPSGE